MAGKALRHQSSNNSPLIVSVVSGKGGVGKSVLTLNLAERASALGVRTLAVDLSLSGGNLHLLANVAPRHGIEQYLRGAASLSQAVTALSPACDLLLRAESGPLTEFDIVMSAADWCDRVRQEASDYDMVIFDHASGMSIVSTTIARHSDISLLVVVPELTSIADGYGLFKYLVEQDGQSDYRLLINRAKSSTDANYIADKFIEMTGKFLRVSPQLAGWIIEDSQIAESVKAQRPLSAMSRQSVAIKQVGQVSQLLCNEIVSRRTPAGEPGEPREPNPSGSVTPQTTINNSPAPADIKG